MGYRKDKPDKVYIQTLPGFYVFGSYNSDTNRSYCVRKMWCKRLYPVYLELYIRKVLGNEIYTGIRSGNHQFPVYFI